MSKIASVRLVLELPTFGKKSPSVCGSCQFEFFTEEEISSLSNKAIEKSGANQNVKTKSDNIAMSTDIVSRENVATSSDQNGDDDDETKSASTGVFDDPIRRQPSLRIKKIIHLISY